MRLLSTIFACLVVLVFSGCQTPEVIPTLTPTVNPTATQTPIPTSLPSPTISVIPTTIPSPVPSLEPGVEIVSIPVDDDINLSGTIYHADSDTLIIFAHMGGLDQTTWADFARKVADKGVSTFTYDMRCCGKSECFGMSTDSKNYKDLVTVMEYLRQRGYNRFVCVGGSMGGGACMNVALREELAGLVLIASPKQFAFETKSFPQDLVSPDMPKLFIYSEKDHYKVIRTAMPDLYNQSPEPKIQQVFPGQWHGTELFDSPYADQFSETLMNFLLSIVLE
jgi:dienelactone hydrolase